MDFVKVFSELKFKSYQLIIQFLVTITVPGILLLFYFYRNLFDKYDLNRLIMLQVAISSTLLMCSYAICSSIILLLELVHKKDDTVSDENVYLESVFIMSSQFSLIILFILLLIFFLNGSKCIHSFVIWFIVIEIAYGVIVYFSLHSMIIEAKKKYLAAKQLAIEAAKDKEKQIQQINEELFKFRKLLYAAEVQLDEIKQFQLFRAAETKKYQLLQINERILRYKRQIEKFETKLKELK